MREIKENSMTEREALVESITMYKENHEEGTPTLDLLLSVLRVENNETELYKVLPEKYGEESDLYYEFINAHLYNVEKCCDCGKWFSLDDRQFLEEEQRCLFCVAEQL